MAHLVGSFLLTLYPRISPIYSLEKSLKMNPYLDGIEIGGVEHSDFQNLVVFVASIGYFLGYSMRS